MHQRSNKMSRSDIQDPFERNLKEVGVLALQRWGPQESLSHKGSIPGGKINQEGKQPMQTASELEFLKGTLEKEDDFDT